MRHALVRSSILRGAVAAAFAGLLLAGCGEQDKQVVRHEPGKYKGRADAMPWDSTPNAWSRSTWTAGDKTSWEAALRQRNQGQNEYTRVSGN